MNYILQSFKEAFPNSSIWKVEDFLRGDDRVPPQPTYIRPLEEFIFEEEEDLLEVPAFCNTPLPPHDPNYWYTRLIKGTHTLIAGCTGCGKSNLLNSLLYEIMGTYKPNECGFVLIDPKRVELADYKNTRYSMAYASESDDILKTLNKVIDLINERYNIMQSQHIRLWQGAHVFVVIDEMADLLVDYDNGSKFKRALQKILQISRASGVSTIACTQAPSRSVLSAPISLNFTDRVALKCNASIESRQIINNKGAELLPEHGKGLYLASNGLHTINVPLLDITKLNERIEYWQK